MHARRKSNIALVAALILAFLYFIHSFSSSLDLDDIPGFSDSARPRNSYYEATDDDRETNDDGDGAAKAKGKDVVQVVLDGLASSASSAKLATPNAAPTTPAPHVPAKPAAGTKASTSTASASSAPPKIPRPDPKMIIPKYDRGLVMGKLQKEETAWVQEYLPDWHHAVYIVDNPSSGHAHTMFNKGREALPYLTYLVEHYDSLPSIIAFLHSHKDGSINAWHNEGRGHDAVVMLRALNMSSVQRDGYKNLRCEMSPGCPDRIQPARGNSTVERAMSDAWRELFGNTNVPKTIAAPCCGQFVVSKEQVLKRPLSDYKRYLEWLLLTTLDDDTSRGIFEYLWHVIFGQEPVYCPATRHCYCDVYMQCTDPQEFAALFDD